MRMRSALFAFLPLAALLGGCPVWGSDGGGGGGNPATCRTNGDCRTGYYCDAAIDECVMSDTCDDDSECAPSMHCDFRDTCVPDVPGACRANTDCATGEVCVEGFCRNDNDGPDNEVCHVNYDCGGGRICVNNVCVAQCTTAAQCGSGQSCVSNRCVTNPSECDTTDDCDGSGVHCVDGRCLEDCTTGTCDNAQDACSTEDDFCHPDWQPSGFCDGNEDCNTAAGSVCDLTDHVCRVRCGGCTVDADCRIGGGTATCNTGTGLCEIDSGDPDATPTAGEFCQSRDVQLSICDAGDGYCHTMNEGAAVECERQADCTGGESCVNGSCE